ncbi:MAG: hypothetical protein A2087_14085 [Spirochaetes bacterium GWD1_61_31]|nr:MAG: hypothetical protein A2Y37_02035 [Spirochaetes bacterium GWB1_60_80]OHD33123.1 MAG: hypothetical protein A2004_12320 [Spirochaetes bacterium GWC1_61_12]OHD39589.1 MAG: hypothetical protein A2087_14085 [Spirochaetes bacterium GWD1_61_31]OHD43856.1 MAG: hypothetical protein A2Y35_00375 [Spirochaetes bacterium GWE1_60_18]OHD61177.1 MAG: hypothetical protein A2Y32_03590 [Spirochaetes bacterium GWF1_60_12]
MRQPWLPFALSMFLLMPAVVPGQTGELTAPTTTLAPADPAGDATAVAVPREFRGVSLGMSLDEVKAILRADGLFHFQGDADVSLLPRPNETLLEVAGLSYVRRAFFQFYEGRLFVMIFAMNERQIDHYAIFTAMTGRYGQPQSLSPGESVWQDQATRLSVERPLAVKYIDLAVFNQLVANGAALESFEEILRQDFLDGF